MRSDRRSVRSRASFLRHFVPLYLALLAGLLLVAAAQTYTVSAAPAAQAGADGQAIFQAKCSGCHTIGGGKLIGPDLKGVTQRRTPQWIRDFITDPAKMIASDPVAKQLQADANGVTMPTLGLSAAELDAILAYLGSGQPAPAPGGQPAVGDPVAGPRLFAGEMGLTGGGPACIACHTAEGTGTLGGGALGPDLTHVVTRLGEPAVAAALQNIVFPTMTGPFLNRPLTPQEQADLVAFLKTTDQSQPPVPVITPGALTTNALLVLGIGSAGTVLLFALLWYLRARQTQRRAADLPARKL